MSWLMAKIYDRFMSASEEACLADWRRTLLADVDGVVLEVGAGTGINLAHYTRSVKKLVLTEPDPHMAAQLEGKLSRSERPEPEVVTVTDARADSLPMADGTFDAVVSTLVLCSVADPRRALDEIHRVLRPGGRFVFIEHVAADDHAGRLRWQRRIEPIWKRIAGGCHLTRRTAVTIEEAGFAIESLTAESVQKAMPIVRPSIRGVARRSG